MTTTPEGLPEQDQIDTDIAELLRWHEAVDDAEDEAAERFHALYG